MAEIKYTISDGETPFIAVLYRMPGFIAPGTSPYTIVDTKMHGNEVIGQERTFSGLQTERTYYLRIFDGRGCLHFSDAIFIPGANDDSAARQ